MHTILKLRSDRPALDGERSRVLVIESDPARQAVLRHVFTNHVGADFQIVSSVNDALTSITHHMPDLVLTSAFLPPQDEGTLTSRLKGLAGAEHLQVITTPYRIDLEDPSGDAATRFLQLWRRRRPLIRRGCDSETLARQIETYLEQARTRRATAEFRPPREPMPRPIVVPMRRKAENPAGLQAAEIPCQPGPAARSRWSQLSASDRRRARRKRGTDVPSLWSVNLPIGGNVRVVDISNHGVLLETTSKIPPGRTVDLQLIGEGTDVCVPVRTTRSEVAAVDGLGVRYRVAATFSRELEMPGLECKVASEAVVPTALADLLTRVMREVDRGAPAAAIRACFEHGLRRLLTARDVQLRKSPVVPDHDSESIYFTVPVASNRQPILQMIFEPKRPPSAQEFRLLKAAANLAAVVVEFAPLEEVAIR
jgi:CheY-like chemotaxis protein